MYETLIRKLILRLKWAISQVCIVSRSRDSQIGPFLVIFTKNTYFSHFFRVWTYDMYETLIGKWILWLKWAISQVCGVSRSRDSQIGPFLTIFTKNTYFIHLFRVWTCGMYETLIGKCIFQLKLAINEVCRLSRSWDSEIGPILVIFYKKYLF